MLPTILASLVCLAAVYVVAGLALQHAAYILIYGSIFESMRKYLADGGECKEFPWVKRFFCRKLHEAIKCQLCTITQLTIWCWAAPITTTAITLGGTNPLAFIHISLPLSMTVMVYALLFAGVTFSQAAVGLACWDVMRLIGRGTNALVIRARAESRLAESYLIIHPLPSDRQPTIN